jgi:hypothetical protein
LTAAHEKGGTKKNGEELKYQGESEIREKKKNKIQ